MVYIQLNGKRYEAGDNGLFGQREITVAIQNMLYNIRSEHGSFEYFNFNRCKDYEYMSFSYYFPFFKDIGVDEPTGDCRPVHKLYCCIELGRGKKNLNNMTLKIRSDIACLGKRSAPEEYKVLRAMIGQADMIETILPLTRELLLDTMYIPRLVNNQIEEGIKKLREMWKIIQNDQMARDIDFSDVGPHITELFDNHHVPMCVGTRGDLQSTRIEITSPDEDEVGSLILENVGTEWRVDLATYAFSFVHELMDVPKYHCVTIINPDKFDDFLGMVAEEFKHQRELRKRFARVRETYVRDIEKK